MTLGLSEYHRFLDLMLREVESFHRDVKHEMTVNWEGRIFPITIKEALPIRLWKARQLLKGKEYSLTSNGVTLRYYEYGIRYSS